MNHRGETFRLCWRESSFGGSSFDRTELSFCSVLLSLKNPDSNRFHLSAVKLGLPPIRIFFGTRITIAHLNGLFNKIHEYLTEQLFYKENINSV